MSLKRNAGIAIALAAALIAAHGLRRAYPTVTVTASKDDSNIEVLEPLDTKVLVRRSIETFPAGYLNNISIIQGVALGLLATRTFGTLDSEHSTLDVVMIVGEALFLMMGIIIAAYEYLWFLTVVRWTPTFRDTLVPFTLGVAEIIPQFFLGTPVAWWVSAAFLTLVGSAAFLNTIVRLRLNLFGGYEKAYTEVRKVLWTLVVCCWVLTAAAVGMAFAVAVLHPLVPVVVMWILLLSTTFLIYVSERALDSVYGHLHVNRRPTRRSDKTS